MPTTSHLVIKIKIICISCDSQKPMIMKQAWHFHCTLLVSKLCGPLQHNMRNCRNISQTSQNLTLRYGWIQVFFYFSLVIFIWFRSQLALKWKKTDNDKSFEKNKKSDENARLSKWNVNISQFQCVFEKRLSKIKNATLF